jgi:hypothetical protein
MDERCIETVFASGLRNQALAGIYRRMFFPYISFLSRSTIQFWNHVSSLCCLVWDDTFLVSVHVLPLRPSIDPYAASVPGSSSVQHQTSSRFEQ